MSEIGSRLRFARQEAGYASAADAAKALGMPYSSYVSHENGATGIRSSVAARYAKRFGVSTDWLLTGDGPMMAGRAPYADNDGLPILGTVQAGTWRDVETDTADLGEATLPLAQDPRVPARQYVLRVAGTSMDQIVADGEYVICADFAELGLALAPGMIVHVQRTMGGSQLVENTLKQVTRSKGKWALVPRSSDPRWQPIEFNDMGEADEAVVMGLAIGRYQPFPVNL